ncbi:MAG: T9SS type A sorting domain-containing protein [Saprospiraceae bacterium]
MKTIGLLLVSLLSFQSAILGQDYLMNNWPFGTNEYPGVDGYGNGLVRFDGNTAWVEYPIELNMNFETTVGVINDSIGNLIAYTNGCYIANGFGDTIPNSAGLNPGEVNALSCPNHGYISPKGAVFIPFPDQSTQYYLIHMGMHFDSLRKVMPGPLYYSVLDMNANMGTGALTTKNTVLLEGELENFEIVRHGNGRDWWLLVPEQNSNRYNRFLIAPNGIEEIGAQEIGPVLICPREGGSAFSQDGSRYARARNCSALVFGFDRCSGVLSYEQEIKSLNHHWGGGGIAFSPDGSILFGSSLHVLWATDLTVPNPVPDTFQFFEYAWGTNIHQMQYGPDHQLYTNSMNRTHYYNQINFSGTSLDSVDFVFNGLPLPAYTIRTLPYFPNFKLYDLEGSVCDTLNINTHTSNLAEKAIELRASPNPVQDVLSISIHGVEHLEQSVIVLKNINGLALEQIPLKQKAMPIEFNMKKYPAGVYFLSVYSRSGHQTIKIVKV